MVAVLLALASSLAYGFADFAGGLATRSAHVLRVVAVAAPASLAIELIVLPLLGGRWSAGAMGWGAASGVASAAAFALLYQSLSMGPMGVLSPITALISAVLPATVGILGGERLRPPAEVGFALALVAVLVISGSGGDRGARPTPAALALAVAAGAAIAGQLICLDQSPSDSGVTPLIAGRAVSGGVLLTAFVLRRHRLPSAHPHFRLAAAAGATDALANLAFLFATRAGNLAVVAVITALYPGGTVLLARATLGERLARTQLIGLFVAAAAITTLALA